jgi:hypothetical protein
MQTAMESAVTELARVVTESPNENARIRAAGMLIENGIKGVSLEQIDLSEKEELRPLLQQVLGNQALEKQRNGRMVA